MKRLIAFLFSLSMTISAIADTIGVHAGAGIWQPDISGSFGLTEQITTQELGLNADDANYFYLALEHPIPVLPNIRITQTNLESNGTAVLTSDFTFDAITFPSGSETLTQLDLSHTDYTAYYEVLDNVASADLGLTFRAFDGLGTLSNATDNESEDLSAVAPMLYGRLQVDLPFSGFYVGGTINYVGLDGDELQDVEARVGYMMSAVAASLGVELGYRKTSLQIDDDDELGVDLNFDGSYAAVVFHF